MGIGNLYNRIALMSPYFEIALRRFYWRNVDRFQKYNPHKAGVKSKQCEHVDFERVLDWLRTQGVGKGSLLIVHSGYDELECTGLSPDQVIDKLLDFVGPTGTLAMPVIRRFKEFKKAKKQGKDYSDVVGKYNVRKTMVSSGILPYTLLHKEGLVVSHHPFNPLCAIGPLAKEMMKHNLDGEAPSPHGKNSCWKFCLDHNAKVCSIGTDIEHHNTIIHVVEEAFGDWHWPDDVWYDRFKFEIIDEDNNVIEKVVSNRKNDWGTLHLAEINVVAAKKKAGVMRSDTIDGITVGFVDPQKMVEFLRSKNKNGYPYFVFPWENVRKIK